MAAVKAHPRKAKYKKPSDFQSVMTKCVFLYGKPNKEKRQRLQQIQTDYTAEVNRFIQLIEQEESLIPYLVKNDHRSGEVRAFEKKHRSELLTSAYSQSAFDMAMDHLYNRVDEIRRELYGIVPCPMTSSKVLFGAALLGKSIEEMQALLDAIIANRKDGGAFYKKLKEELAALTDFTFLCTEIRTLYAFLCEEHKIPRVKKARVRLVSKLYRLEKSSDIKAPYVISITDPLKSRERMQVPLSASADGLRRLDQYGGCHTVEYTVREDGWIQVAVAFKKKIPDPKLFSYRGVDVGITDMLCTSDGQAYGTFSECLAFYKDQVEPAFAVMNGIRSKKRRLKAFLKKHKAFLRGDVIRSIRQKMDRLDLMLRKMQEPYRRRNEYNSMQAHGIKEVVEAYVDSLNGDKSICTVVELLDMKEFHSACRRRNQYLSSFARGMLSKKLMETLNWKGYAYKQVEPAYTSQTCPVCGCVDKKSRDGKQFHCVSCGYTDDADHVGSQNIRSRAEDKELQKICEDLQYNKKARHAAVRELLEKRHQTYWTENMMGAYI